jgi:hypothetical protein
VNGSDARLVHRIHAVHRTCGWALLHETQFTYIIGHHVLLIHTTTHEVSIMELGGERTARGTVGHNVCGGSYPYMFRKLRNKKPETTSILNPGI